MKPDGKCLIDRKYFCVYPSHNCSACEYNKPDPLKVRPHDVLTTLAIASIIAMMVLFVFKCAASAEVFTNGLTPTQAIQSGNTCWAAAAAGELVSTDWAMSTDPQAVYQDITSHLGYSYGSIEYAVTWYLDYYYPTGHDSSVQSYGYGISGVVADINKGWAAVAIVSSGSALHDLQIYAYETDSSGAVAYLDYVNSWYRGSGLERDYIGDGFFYGVPNNIYGVVGLMPFDEYEPAPYQPPTLPPPPSDPPPARIPEPEIPLLVAWGIAGVGFMRRREWYDCAA